MSDSGHRYRFVEQNEGMTYKPARELTTFYQICQYPVRGKIWVRKMYVDEQGFITNQKATKYKPKRIKEFIKNAPANKYSIHPTHTLDNVELPSGGQILAAKSSIINNNSEYSGYAQWN